MFKKFFLLLLVLPLLSFQGLHKFYVSVTEIEYSQENSSLQIISRVFTDDMEKLLKTRYDEDLYLTKKEEHPSADDFLERYISQKLEISVNGKPYHLNYLGKEYDKDLLLLYIEVENVPPLESISVKNQLLTGLFPDQKNVVHVEYQETTKSLLFSRHVESGVIKFRKQ